MRIFLAYPFTQLLNQETGLIDEKNTNLLLGMIDQIKEMGHTVFSAQFREHFGAKLMEAAPATYEDFKEMEGTDLVVAFPGQFPISGGVHVELGWGSALGKQFIIFLHKDESYSPMVEGLHTLTNVKYVRFGSETQEELTQKVVDEISVHNKILEKL
ncbi:hypothetical protein A3844_04330 [Paenibacillus helianthi]|uniref:Nucleoside 2-deoxyribosyltransferase n=1 Tax=Paenibacillus helianthi TaxID=1349432 RepID=A0ABX3EU07_9BACL|nr:nucleoside 2-deoxyribosyltransferase [Paenibacillus helianthi]OKP91075.1 hypothetical protein A3844_04330 [Paenibacillus helianthi]